jgi:hypothetical protein
MDKMTLRTVTMPIPTQQMITEDNASVGGELPVGPELCAPSWPNGRTSASRLPDPLVQRLSV